MVSEGGERGNETWTKEERVSDGSKYCKGDVTVWPASKQLGPWLAAGLREGLFQELIFDLRLG